MKNILALARSSYHGLFRNKFEIWWKPTPDLLLDQILSDMIDIYIFFIKRESGSRLSSTQFTPTQKWCSLHVCLQQFKHNQDLVCWRPYIFQSGWRRNFLSTESNEHGMFFLLYLILKLEEKDKIYKERKIRLRCGASLSPQWLDKKRELYKIHKTF